MKIVKADAKGRITGFKAGELYLIKDPNEEVSVVAQLDRVSVELGYSKIEELIARIKNELH